MENSMKKDNIIPIAFAFDNNMILPACVCISSLLRNARDNTFYDIFILHSHKESLDCSLLDKLSAHYAQCRMRYREVDDFFDDSFEIRGINNKAYYRLLIPELIPQYDKILYSDIDVIFRSDLSEIYQTNLDGYYVAGVNSLSHFMPTLQNYYTKKLHLKAESIIYSGNLIINSKALLADGKVDEFRKHADKKYVFQDMDIINIVCAGKIKYLPPSFCVTTYIQHFALYHRAKINQLWEDNLISDALKTGIVHYNGAKPWNEFCINYDIWWEYYRKSPVFDSKFYYDFYEAKSNGLDKLSLWKRIKILVRYFVYGKSK